MWTCRLCRFPVELDDVELKLLHGRCICLRCYSRETGGARDMPKALRHELLTTLATLELTAG